MAGVEKLPAGNKIGSLAFSPLYKSKTNNLLLESKSVLLVLKIDPSNVFIFA